MGPLDSYSAPGGRHAGSQCPAFDYLQTTSNVGDNDGRRLPSYCYHILDFHYCRECKRNVRITIKHFFIQEIFNPSC